ncbi:MAG: exodeoxyribonuclease V subunit beta [Wenzhouxiangellaceae bacterium]|nr:exodeoxyribonuclease V subunit beta [Wenzhouxiangellaceae bacterium]
MSQPTNQLDPLRFPLNGLRLIEASAGTGKTYSIAALYVRLVLGHGPGEPVALMPPDILVLTYTRAATQELRERIRQRLTEVAAAFRPGQGTDDAFIARLVADYQPDQHASCASRLQRAAEWMDEAAIHTIHAWCQAMLRQHAFDSGSLFSQELESEDRERFDQVVKDYWRRHFYHRYPGSLALKGFATDPEALSKLLRGLLKPGLVIHCGGRPASELAPEQAMDQLEQRWQALRKGWRADRDAITGVLRDAVDQKLLNRPYNAPGQLDDWFALLDRWAERGGPPPEVLRSFQTDAIKGKRSKKASDREVTHPWFDQVAELFAYAIVPGLCVHAVRWVRARYQAEKRRAHRLDFDDLLVQLDEALAGAHGDRLRQRILQTFPVALIDEFQDTDPVQYRIFERVYLPERAQPNNALIMIGDPKQSIYGFRGADIHTYLSARAQTEAADRFTLPVNYRSSEAMVQAVNALFEAGRANAGGAFGFRDRDFDPMPFEPVQANGQPERLIIDGKEPAALTFWYQPPPEGDMVAKTRHQPAMAARTACRIVALLNGAHRDASRTGFKTDDGALAPVRPADIAVLVNGRFEAAEVRNALRLRGVGSVYLSDRDSVFDQPEALDVLALLEAAAQPLDDQRVRRALACACLGLTLDELAQLARDDNRLEQAIETFQQLGRMWRERGVLAMLRRLMADYALPVRLKAQDAGWERRLTNLLHLAELLQAEAAQRDGPQGLIDWLRAEIARDNRSDNDSEIIRLESDEGLVQVVTVHKSKGLQYDLVFVPFAGCYVNPSRNVIEYHDEHGQRIAELDPDNTRAVERSRRAAVQERIRLLYVAVTRARHACWVGVAPVNQCQDAGLNCLLTGLAASLKADSPGGLHGALLELAQTSAHIAVEIVDELQGQTPIETLLPEQAPFECLPALLGPQRPRERWWIASYSALRHSDVRPSRDAEDNAGLDRIGELLAEQAEQSDLEPQAPDRPDRRAPQRDSIHAFPRGAIAGNLLHDVLEWAGTTGFATVLEQPDALETEIRTRLTRRRWQDHTPVLVDWLPRQLQAPIRLGDSTTRLVDLGDDQNAYRCELGFLLAAHDVDVSELDRLVCAHTVNAKPRNPFAPDTLKGMLSGFIDLVFEHDGRWFVADYKSNHLGPDAGSYTVARMADEILAHRYDMQFVLYQLALHRLLKQRLGAAYRPEAHLGGAAYLFLRGSENRDTAGVYFEPAAIELIESLDRRFAGAELHHVP